jgi:hypothetical protein
MLMSGIEPYWIYVTAGVGLTAGVLGAAVTQGFTGSRAERDADRAKASLIKGIGQEYRLNLFEALQEFQTLILDDTGHVIEDLTPQTRIVPVHSVALIPVEPRLHQSAMHNLAPLDHSGLAVIGFGYREIERHKGDIRSALSQGQLRYAQVQAAVGEVIEGLALLYMWRNHYGKTPADLPGLRKKELLGYAREQGLHRYAFPGLHLFDMLVNYIRGLGLKVTPVPLKLPAKRYYALPPGDRNTLRKAAQRREALAAEAQRRAERRAEHEAKQAAERERREAERAARDAKREAQAEAKRRAEAADDGGESARD